VVSLSLSGLEGGRGGKSPPKSGSRGIFGRTTIFGGQATNLLLNLDSSGDVWPDLQILSSIHVSGIEKSDAVPFRAVGTCSSVLSPNTMEVRCQQWRVASMNLCYGDILTSHSASDGVVDAARECAVNS